MKTTYPKNLPVYIAKSWLLAEIETELALVNPVRGISIAIKNAIENENPTINIARELYTQGLDNEPLMIRAIGQTLWDKIVKLNTL